jgi:hypothetical protein
MKKSRLFNLLLNTSLLIVFSTVVVGLSHNSFALVDLTPDTSKPIETTTLEYDGAILQFILQTEESE